MGQITTLDYGKAGSMRASMVAVLEKKQRCSSHIGKRMLREMMKPPKFDRGYVR